MIKSKKDTLTRSDIEESLVKEFPHIPKTEIVNALDIILNSIVEAVSLDDRVEIRGFGTFSKKYIRPRKFVNPKTKKVDYLGETSTMHFKASKSMVAK